MATTLAPAPAPPPTILDNASFLSFPVDNRIKKALEKLNFRHPTLIQAKAVPLALQGKDVLARARTGSGKTAAYSIPVIQRVLTIKESGKSDQGWVKALILLPTKELCEQVKDHFKSVLHYCDNISVLQLASDASESVKMRLADMPDILVSTPSRLVPYLKSKEIDLSRVEEVVLDEADALLLYGYNDDIQFIASHLPSIYHAYLMSATLSPEVENLKKLVLHTPVVLKLEEVAPDVDPLAQYSIDCKEEDKYVIVYGLVKLRAITGKCIFFVNTIDKGFKLKLFFDRFSIKSAVLNSELPANSRYHMLQEFNKGIFDFLIATDENSPDAYEEGEDQPAKVLESGGAETDAEPKDADESGDDEKNNPAGDKMDEDNNEDEADKEEPSTEENGGTKTPKKKKTGDEEYGVSRGIDFKGVSTVINFDFPHTVKSYVHRIGRTARGGSAGVAVSFVTDADTTTFEKLQHKLGKENRAVKPYNFNKQVMEGFRYRVEDMLRSVSRRAVRDARLRDIKHEILNSEKLKAHFDDNPKDLQYLHHMPLQAVPARAHLKFLPSYLIPAPLRGALGAHNATAVANSVPLNRAGNPKKRRADDPLINFQLEEADLKKPRKPIRKGGRKKKSNHKY